METSLDKKGFGLQNNTYSDIQGRCTCSTVRVLFSYLFRVMLCLEKITRGFIDPSDASVQYDLYSDFFVSWKSTCRGGGTVDGRRRNFARRLRKVKTCASTRPYRG